MALTYNQLFEEELRRAAEEAEAVIVSNLAAGMAVKDFAEYRHEVGRIAGLRMIADLCDTVNSKLAER